MGLGNNPPFPILPMVGMFVFGIRSSVGSFPARVAGRLATRRYPLSRRAVAVKLAKSRRMCCV